MVCRVFALLIFLLNFEDISEESKMLWCRRDENLRSLYNIPTTQRLCFSVCCDELQRYNALAIPPSTPITALYNTSGDWRLLNCMLFVQSGRDIVGVSWNMKSGENLTLIETTTRLQLVYRFMLNRSRNVRSPLPTPKTETRFPKLLQPSIAPSQFANRFHHRYPTPKTKIPQKTPTPIPS